MGWTRQAVLQVEKLKLPDSDSSEATLWTRHGLEGVRVEFSGHAIEIPREEILALVAEEYRNERISYYEDLTDSQAIAEMFRRFADEP